MRTFTKKLKAKKLSSMGQTMFIFCVGFSLLKHNKNVETKNIQYLTSLPNLLQILEQFKLLSNLKINCPKSFALNVFLPTTLAKQCQLNFPFQWKTGAITYMGIQLPTDLAELYSRNFQTELPKI